MRRDKDKCQYECKKHYICEKDYFCNPATCNCENWKYLASITDDSTIICDEVIKLFDEELFNENFNEKIVTCKTQSFIFYLHFC